MKNKLALGLIIGFLSGCLVGFLVFSLIGNNSESNFDMPNQQGMQDMEGVPNQDFEGGFEFQLDDSLKEEVVSLFDSSPTSEEVESYCEENPSACMYYCMEVDRDNSLCETINFRPEMER